LEQSKSLSLWLKDYKEVVDWLKGAPGAFIREIVSVLQKKVNLKNEAEADSLVNLLSELEKQKMIPENSFYFNESDGQFHWNEELLK
jgi:hypothetical protein